MQRSQLWGATSPLDPETERQLGLLEPIRIPPATEALQTFRDAHYPKKPLQSTFSKPTLSKWKWKDLFWPLGSLGATFALVTLLLYTPKLNPKIPHQRNLGVHPDTDTILTGKGQTQWAMLFAKANTRQTSFTQKAKHKQILKAHDLIQFVYQQPNTRHVMIVSANRKGAITACLPLLGTHSIRVTAGTGTLPHKASMELDESVGYERFYVISSSTSFAFSQVKKAFRLTWRKNMDIQRMKTIPGPWSVHSFLIRKQSSPPMPRFRR